MFVVVVVFVVVFCCGSIDIFLLDLTFPSLLSLPCLACFALSLRPSLGVHPQAGGRHAGLWGNPQAGHHHWQPPQHRGHGQCQ